MARTKKSYPECQSWTRCNVPTNRPIPNGLEQKADVHRSRSEWQESLRKLVRSPGYTSSICARDIDQPENVLFIITWQDEASLQSFINSPAYEAYFQALFGQPYPPFPSAFFLINPRWVSFHAELVTIFTFTFPYPITPEDRKSRLRGLETHLPGDRLGSRNMYFWRREPQPCTSGQIVERGMISHSWHEKVFRSARYAHSIVSGDSSLREEWERDINLMSPLTIEEITWDFSCSREEDDGGIWEEEVDEEDDEQNQWLATRQFQMRI